MSNQSRKQGASLLNSTAKRGMKYGEKVAAELQKLDEEVYRTLDSEKPKKRRRKWFFDLINQCVVRKLLNMELAL